MSSIQQVVTGDGEFDTAGVESYLASVGLARGSAAYTTVAIMGPQSSGKSTLLNTLFGTVFEELDAMTGRHQTTRGIWLARSQTISEPISLVMDLEGSDGRERGEDDTSFERQSALFALSNADVLLINMWAKDVGREAGSGKPLLKTILQVNLKLFGSQRLGAARASLPRTVLLFVFRDKTRTPLELLTQTWETDLQRIWDGVTKPAGLEDASLTDLFELKYAALSNYEDRPEEFQADCAALRRRFTPAASPAESLLRPHPEKLPGSALALSLATAWDTIRANRDLDLPAHRVMVATMRCEELAARQLEAFREADDWLALCAEAAEVGEAEEVEMEADAALPAPPAPST
ncbi:root hair defective 3 GTP-binding protein, partial [Helicosporidium sp. ATCC 50920]